MDANNESAAGGVYVDVDGKPFPAFYGTYRPDVANSSGIPAYRYSGFERFIPISEIGASAHELSLIAVTADVEGYHQPDRKVALGIK